MNIIKIKGATVAVTAANTVGDSALVRIYASATTVVTHTGVGSITMPADSVLLLEKGATDTLSADVEILCTPVAYKA